MPGATELDETGEALWRAVGEDWADEARHARFIQHAYTAGSLAAAAARYRGGGAPPAGDTLAAKMIARITVLATQQALRPTPPPSGRGLTRSPFFIGVVLAAAITGAILGLLWRGGR